MYRLENSLRIRSTIEKEHFRAGSSWAERYAQAERMRKECSRGHQPTLDGPRMTIAQQSKTAGMAVRRQANPVRRSPNQKKMACILPLLRERRSTEGVATAVYLP